MKQTKIPQRYPKVKFREKKHRERGNHYFNDTYFKALPQGWA
jgi:hypothetical protein